MSARVAPLLPAMRAFNPDLLLLSAGFDGGNRDQVRPDQQPSVKMPDALCLFSSSSI